MTPAEQARAEVEFPEHILERARREIPLRVTIDERGCWRWQGAHHKGYGTWGLIEGRGPFRVHRLSYAAFVGPIPAKALILHDCDVYDCCNPKHVYPGTHTQNMNDRNSRGRTAEGDRTGSRLYPERRPRGEDNGRAKLTAERVRELRARYAQGDIGQRTLAVAYGISKSQIATILLGRQWVNV